MKKVLFVLALGAFAACGSGENKEAKADTAAVTVDTTKVDTSAMKVDTSAVKADTTTKK